MNSAILLSLMFVGGPGVGDNTCRPVAGFALCGEWTDHADYSDVVGDATIETLGLTIHLPAADLRVTLDPPALVGEVDFALPGVGMLSDWSVFGPLPRAQVQLGLGAGLDSVEIGGVDLPLADEHPYLVFEIDGGLELLGGNAIVSASAGPTAKVIIDPLDPLIYLEGDIVTELTGGFVTDGAVGVSLQGALPWASEAELYNGDNWKHRKVSGHLLAGGTVQLGQYPVYLSSTVVIDADRDRDGQWVSDPFESKDDFRLGADGGLAVGWDKGGVSLTLPLGSGSVVYDAPAGLLMVAGELDVNPYSGTPFESLFVGAEGGYLWGHFDDTDDFTLHVEVEAPILGFPASDVEMTLTEDGITFGGTFRPAYGDFFGDQSVQVIGSMDTDGQFMMQGGVNLNVGGFELAQAVATWTNDGLWVHGWTEVPGVSAAVWVQGSLQTNGAFELTGSTTFSPLGLTMAATTVTLSNAGVALTGRVDVPGLGEVLVHGSVQANGAFELSGVADFEPFGLSLANSAVTVSNAGIFMESTLEVPGLSSVRVGGEVGLDGTFELSGDADLEVKGFELARAHVEVSGEGVHIDGRIDALIAKGRISGTFTTSATQANATVEDPLPGFFAGFVAPVGLQLSGTMAISIPLPDGKSISLAGGKITLSDRGLRASGKAELAGAHVKVRGSVTSSGKVNLTGSAGYDISLFGTGISGDLTLTATHKKLTGRISARACVNVVLAKVCEGASATVGTDGKATLDMPSPVPDITLSMSDLKLF
jgi:hypothetical protein